MGMMSEWRAKAWAPVPLEPQVAASSGSAASTSEAGSSREGWRRVRDMTTPAYHWPEASGEGGYRAQYASSSSASSRSGSPRISRGEACTSTS